MSDADAVDALLCETEDFFSDSSRRTAPTRSVLQVASLSNIVTT